MTRPLDKETTMGGTQPTYDYEAVFPLVRYATRFVDHVSFPGWAMIPGTLKQQGRTVTWQSYKGDREYLRDMLETVGHFGSAPQGRKATLNGFNAPASY